MGATLRTGAALANASSWKRRFSCSTMPGEGGRGAALSRSRSARCAPSGWRKCCPALEALQAAVRGGAHAAGFLAYEAGYALDPALADAARQGEGPLLWFGLFERFEEVDAASVLPDPDGAWNGQPQPARGARRIIWRRSPRFTSSFAPASIIRSISPFLAMWR